MNGALNLRKLKSLSVLGVLALVAVLGSHTAQAQLEVQVTETGRISLSSDGSGSVQVSSTIHAEKPNAGSTVRSAYFTCASAFGAAMGDGDVSLDGTPIIWDSLIMSGAYDNGFADVTSLVKPKVDAAPPGLVSFTREEGAFAFSVDGCGLYVIFDNPSLTIDSTIVILFGGQDSAGDSFSVTLAEPLEASDEAEMGLAISFSFQGGGPPGTPECGTTTQQFSTIDVNGARLTSCAGNYDDGLDLADGSLITVGGIGDNTDNPDSDDCPGVKL